MTAPTFGDVTRTAVVELERASRAFEAFFLGEVEDGERALEIARTAALVSIAASLVRLSGTRAP